MVYKDLHILGHDVFLEGKHSMVLILQEKKKKPPTKTCNCWPEWCCCGCCCMGKRKRKKLKTPKFEIMETSHRKVHSESSIVEGALKYIEHGTILYLPASYN